MLWGGNIWAVSLKKPSHVLLGKHSMVLNCCRVSVATFLWSSALRYFNLLKWTLEWHPYPCFKSSITFNVACDDESPWPTWLELEIAQLAVVPMRYFQKEFIEEGDTPEEKEKASWTPALAVICLQTEGVMWPVSKQSCHHDFKLVTYHIPPKLWAKINPFLCKLFSQVFCASNGRSKTSATWVDDAPHKTHRPTKENPTRQRRTPFELLVREVTPQAK